MKMKGKTLALYVIVSLALSIFAVAPVSAETKPIVVAHHIGAASPHPQLAALANLTGVEWRIILGELTPANLSGAKMLIMSKSDPAAEYTTAELDAIASWYNQSGKTIWVAGYGDHTMDQPQQYTANEVLEKIGSKLRIEDCSVEDYISNADIGYRVLGVSDYVDPPFEFIVTGVERALFHAPSLVIGYVDDQYVDLTVEDIDDVYIIMTTSYGGVVVDYNPPPPHIMTEGDEGVFPLMVFEVDWAKRNLIIATGESPFGHGEGMYKPELLNPERYGPDGYRQQGAVLVENILKYATVFGDEMISLQTNIWDKEETITSLTVEKATLQSQVNTLTTEKNQLQANLTAAQSTASTMQLVAVAALIIGVVIGYFVSPMVKK